MEKTEVNEVGGPLGWLDRIDAITRLCSCGPTKFVLELLASVKIEWASSSCERVSDIFCAIVEVGFN